jgi:SpoVK/Ycf46/Vps4 family AAA+-type ATPase
VRAEMWQRAVDSAGGIAGEDLAALAHRYRVGPGAIVRAVSSTVLADGIDRPLGAAALATGLRHNIAERLGGLATRVEVTQSWDDLVIGDDTADLIAGVVGRVRHAHQVLDRWGYRAKIARGAGVAALFSGAPGTGKTMVAGLIAKELDLELYQVDLGNVVSKWVGETEKNLARVFDAAEEGHALLLLDEADALFGARSSEVKSANDRYANLEVNYLLQRVEAFGGITILTTNLDTAIDPALKRRLAAHIVFGMPDDDERCRLWERQTTTGTAPLARDVDPDALSRAFPLMSGANIRNAAISAAFLAASDDASAITQHHLVRAARAEYRAMGHMVSEAIVRR